MKTLGEKLSQLCKSHNISQREFANILGISEPAVSKYIANKGSPSKDTLYKIATYFNVSMDWLMGRTNISKVLDPNCEVVMLHAKAKDIISYILTLDSEELESFFIFCNTFLASKSISMENYKNIQLFAICEPVQNNKNEKQKEIEQ